MQKIIFILICAALNATVLAIKCFSCESVYELNCAEDFEAEPHFKLDCDHIEPPRHLDINLEVYPNATACLKQTYKERGVPKVVRHCFFGNINETERFCSIDPTLTSIEELGCYVCSDDNFCNHATEQLLGRGYLSICLSVIISILLINL